MDSDDETAQSLSLIFCLPHSQVMFESGSGLCLLLSMRVVGGRAHACVCVCVCTCIQYMKFWDPGISITFSNVIK